MNVIGILFITFVCGVSVGVVIMAFVKGAASLELLHQSQLKDQLIEDMTGDWLTIFVQPQYRSAKPIADRWVGENGELARISNDEL